MSYTEFEVMDASVTVVCEGGRQISHDQGDHAFKASSIVMVQATVRNSGNRRGGWPVFVQVQDDACIVPPAGPMLKRFTRVDLAAGESSQLQFTVRLCYPCQQQMLTCQVEAWPRPMCHLK